MYSCKDADEDEKNSCEPYPQQCSFRYLGTVRQDRVDDPQQAADRKTGTPEKPVMQEFGEDVCEEDENDGEDQLYFVGQFHTGILPFLFILGWMLPFAYLSGLPSSSMK